MHYFIQHLKRIQHYKEVCMYEGVEMIFNLVAFSTHYYYRIHKYINIVSFEHIKEIFVILLKL